MYNNLRYGLNYTKVDNVNLIGYVDADYANDFKSRKSLTGYISNISKICTINS